MARPKLTRPTDGEIEILRVLWARGEATARDVSDAFSSAGRPMTVNAAGVALRSMIERGLVKLVDERRPQKFAAVSTQAQTFRSFTADLKERLFGGSLRDLVKHALSGRKATPQEIAELKRIVDEIEE